MTIDMIREKVISLVQQYHITRVVLFGSRASGSNSESSDVDLIVEFSQPVTLMQLSQLRIELEELLGLDVDVIHGPVRETDIIEIGSTIELYAA